MNTIDPNLLDTVTGGTTPVSPGPISSGGSDGNNQVLSTLQNIESSIKDLGNNHNGGLFGGGNGAMLMMTMAFAMSRQNTTIVYGGGGGGWHHHGWGFRAW